MDTGVLTAIGNTPMVRLIRIFPGLPFPLYGKLEGLNPGGSAKDRSAWRIVQRALSAGLIGPDTVIVESSSGNMGIGLAQACSSLGLRFICVIDPRTTAQNVRLLKAYGVEIEMVQQPDPVSGEFLQARLNRVRELQRALGNTFWPNQYENRDNAEAHHQTMAEIHRVLGDEVAYVFCAVSTCGTLRGCAEYIRAHRLCTTLIAVDAAGSAIFDTTRRKRLIPGHGAGVRPGLFDLHLADDHVIVTDLQCVIGCRRLVRAEGILAGGSSGAVLMAVHQLRNVIPGGAPCAAILPDRGERYLDTVFSDEWVTEHFGAVPDVLTAVPETKLCTVAS
jgi:N-(2-amino-2-carboxyethyl)-L-glutamate synthase